MSRIQSNAFCIVFCMFFIMSAHADVTIYPAGTGDWPTIQAGIDNVVSGETVWLVDGTYTGLGNRDLNFFGKDITVRSISNNPELCIIDGENQEVTGITFENNETHAATVQGITIGNMDQEEYGGGIRCYLSSPSITNCIITGCDLHAHKEDQLGAGIHCSDSSPIITNCQIINNSMSGGYGGGIYIINNSSPTLINCTIGNNATGFLRGGGGICSRNSSFEMINCTLSGNDGYEGGGISLKFTSSALIVNSIVWGNSGTDGHEIYMVDGSTMDVQYSDIQGGVAEAFVTGGSTLTFGAGNIDLDPHFISTLDFHLTELSNCVDQGTNDTGTWPNIPATDIDGDARPLGSAVEMGSDEILMPPTPTPTETPTPTVTPRPIPATSPRGNITLLLILSAYLLFAVSTRTRN